MDVPRVMDELLPDHRVIEQVAVGSLNDPGVLELILGVHTLQRETGIDDTLLDCRALSQNAAPINLIGLADRVATLGLRCRAQATRRSTEPADALDATRDAGMVSLVLARPPHIALELPVEPLDRSELRRRARRARTRGSAPAGEHFTTADQRGAGVRRDVDVPGCGVADDA